MMTYKLTEYPEAVIYLTEIFDLINESFFESAFSNVKPVITIQSTPETYGHTQSVWRPEARAERPEINVSAETLNRPIEEVVATMIHTAIHLYHRMLRIQDTSRGGTYHNSRFKAAAEERGLEVTRDSRGWSVTTPSDSLKRWCTEMELERIRLSRYEATAKADTKETEEDAESEAITKAAKTSSTRKYICPNCQASVRATREITLFCGECYDGVSPATLYALRHA